jgi:deoxycytidine triphosphate deaminase
VDPGYNGTLTLEFKNMSNFHSILLRPGDRIGQLVFFQGQEVSIEQSYRTKGNYNNNTTVAQIGYANVDSGSGRL